MSVELGMTEGAVAVLTGLVGVVWRQLTGRVKKLEDNQMSKELCDAHGKMLEQKIAYVQERIAELKGTNKEDHEHLSKTLGDIAKVLTDMRDCVNKLSVGADCE